MKLIQSDDYPISTDFGPDLQSDQILHTPTNNPHGSTFSFLVIFVDYLPYQQSNTIWWHKIGTLSHREGSEKNRRQPWEMKGSKLKQCKLWVCSKFFPNWLFLISIILFGLFIGISSFPYFYLLFNILLDFGLLGFNNFFTSFD